MNNQIITDLQTTDVWAHLAREEHFLLAGPRRALYLWKAADAVVIGKNQNPWHECAVSRLPELGLSLARRISGGGTVYHDLGNLNFAFICPREDYDFDRQLAIIADALGHFGIEAKQGDRHELRVAEGKISGNAFRYHKNRVLHHGTLLVNADLERLHLALEPELTTITSRCVASVRSDVVNLSQLRPDIDEAALVARIIASYCAATEEAVSLDASALPVVTERRDEFHRWDWLFGQTPRFTVTHSCGGQTLNLTVQRGRVSAVTGGEEARAHAIVGERYHPQAIQKLAIG